MFLQDKNQPCSTLEAGIIPTGDYENSELVGAPDDSQVFIFKSSILKIAIVKVLNESVVSMSAEWVDWGYDLRLVFTQTTEVSQPIGGGGEL